MYIDVVCFNCQIPFCHTFDTTTCISTTWPRVLRRCIRTRCDCGGVPDICPWQMHNIPEWRNGCRFLLELNICVRAISHCSRDKHVVVCGVSRSHFEKKIHHASSRWIRLQCKLHLYKTLKFGSIFSILTWPSFDSERGMKRTFLATPRILVAYLHWMEIPSPGMEKPLYDPRKWYLLSHYVFLSWFVF